MVAILLAGFVAYVQLPVSALPQVDYPTIQVQTFYPGASPEVMASSVTAPLERQFGQIPGLSQMTSTSSGGGSVITLQFSLEESAVRVQANPTALANYGLSLEDIRAAVGTANVDQAKGSLTGATQSYTIGANDQIPTSSGYNNLIIAYRGGSPVRLSDVANAVDSAENLFQAAWMGTSARPASDGQPAKPVTLQ